jgi:hypothetical protein
MPVSGARAREAAVIGGTWLLAFVALGCDRSSGSGRAGECARLAPAACVDPDWAEWRMPNSSVDVATGAPNGQSYTAHGDGTVTDDITGLMWQQTTPKATYAWNEAKTYCSTLTLGGFRDWRVPSAIELVSIVDYGVASPTPSIDIMAFPKTPADIFWSSTPVAGASSEAWYVNFSYGYAVSTDVSEINHVRCVR